MFTKWMSVCALGALVILMWAERVSAADPRSGQRDSGYSSPILSLTRGVPGGPEDEPEESPGSLFVEGVMRHDVNPSSVDLRFRLEGAQFSLDPAAVLIELNGVQQHLGADQITDSAISTTLALSPGRNVVSFFGLDRDDLPLQYETVAWSGGQSIKVEVFDEQINRVPNAEIRLSLVDDPLVASVRLTDARGLVRFDHLPDRTVLIHAFLAGVGEAVTGVVIGSDDAGVQLVLRGIGEPSPIPNNDFSLGLLGWEVGESPVALVPHEELIQGQVDNDLRLMTDFEGPVSVSRTFVSKPGVRTARVRYRFITSEIPGGYCGSIYNDYYSVSIRALAGAATSDSASMNSLGCAAFDAQGKTAWKELTLPVAEQGDVVQVDVSVANVGDGAFDSSVVLDFVAEQTLNIETVSLRDIDNEPLQFLSASPHPYLGGLTPVHGSIRIIGAEDDALADLTLELLEGSQVVATGLLAPGAMATLLAPFGSDGAVEMTSPARLFEVPASQFPLVCRPESSLQLRIRATSAGGESVTRELGTKPMLVLYDGNNRYGERDSAEGGDGWTRQSLLCMLSHFLSSGLLYNDMSNMHGGRFHPHSSHADGTHVDAWFSGYNERDAMTAAKLISLLNDPTFGGRIRRVLVTYPASETHPFRLVINKTILDDGRPASNVIRHAQKHERHFHLMLSTSN